MLPIFAETGADIISKPSTWLITPVVTQFVELLNVTDVEFEAVATKFNVVNAAGTPHVSALSSYDTAEFETAIESRLRFEPNAVCVAMFWVDSKTI